MKFYFLDSHLRGNDTLRLTPRKERGYFIRLKCYDLFEDVREFQGGQTSNSCRFRSRADAPIQMSNLPMSV